MQNLLIRTISFVFSLSIFTVTWGQTITRDGDPSGVVLQRQNVTARTSATPRGYDVIQASAETTPELTSATFPALGPKPAADASTPEGDADNGRDVGIARPAITVTSSLAVVLGLFAAMVWITRKFNGRTLAQGNVPKEVLYGLGSTAIDARTRVTLVRCGNRILVMAQSPTGVYPLAEITDPQEVIDLSARCLGDSKKSFASTLQTIENEPTESGFIASAQTAPKPRSRGRLFANA